MKKEKFIQKIIEKTKDTLQELNFDTYDIIIHPDNHLFMIGVNGNPICVCHIEEARQYHKENDIKIKNVYNKFFKDEIVNKVEEYIRQHSEQLSVQELDLPLSIENNSLTYDEFNEQYVKHLQEIYPDYQIKINSPHLYNQYLITNDYETCDNLISNKITNYSNAAFKNLLLDFDVIKNYIYPVFLDYSVSLNENLCIDLDTPFKICYFIHLNEISPFTGKIKITNDLIQKWNVNQNQIKRIAISNLYKYLPQEETEYSWNGLNLVIKNSVVGSAIILNEAVRDEIHQKLGLEGPAHYYILSDSTTDCLEINKTGIESGFDPENTSKILENKLCVEVYPELDAEIEQLENETEDLLNLD